MAGSAFIGKDSREARKIINQYTDKHVADKNRAKILQRYAGKYNIDGEVATVKGRRVNIEYLPSLDTILESIKAYEKPAEVVGAALYKIEKDQRISLTDISDKNLRKVYEIHQKSADELANRLLKLTTEDFNYQWTHILAIILSGSFEVVFGQTYGAWRKSLSQKNTT